MTLGVILAGGNSRRMGVDKALVETAGRPMVEWVAAALGRVCDKTVVVGREGQLAGLPCLPDTQARVRGPLAGLSTALLAANGADVLMVAVDQPFVRPETLQRLIDLQCAAVPIDGARQVTCAAYPASWVGDVADEIAFEGSIQSLLDRLAHRRVEASEWRAWGEDGRSWFSVDTQETMAEGLARYGAPG